MNRIVRFFLIIICLSIFLFSGYKLTSTLLEYRKAEEFYDQTSSQFVTSAPPTVSGHAQTPVYPAVSQPNSSGSEDSSGPETPEITDISPIFVDFPSLMNINDQIVGWLYCEDTVINYPVMQSEDNNYYLHRMLDGSYNYSGSLFMDFRCEADFTGGNSVIYGHNMKNGTMLHSLVEYKDPAFYKKHSIMYLLTPNGNYALYLFAGFVTPSDSWVYTFSFNDREEKEEYLQKCLESSSFTADFIPSADDPLVTLSTCSHDYGNSRYVVMGILKPAY